MRQKLLLLLFFSREVGGFWDYVALVLRCCCSDVSKILEDFKFHLDFRFQICMHVANNFLVIF